MSIKLLAIVIILLIWGDGLSTYLCLTQVPGSEEWSPLVIPLINWWGVGVAMVISCIVRSAGVSWLYSLAITGARYRSAIYIGMGFVSLFTLAANVNNWGIWLNSAF